MKQQKATELKKPVWCLVCSCVCVCERVGVGGCHVRSIFPTSSLQILHSG